MAVDMCVDSEEALEDLCEARTEGFGKGHADAGGEDGFVVDGRLYPGHEVLDVDGSCHFGGPLVLGFVLPEVLVSAKS